MTTSAALFELFKQLKKMLGRYAEILEMRCPALPMDPMDHRDTLSTAADPVSTAVCETADDCRVSVVCHVINTSTHCAKVSPVCVCMCVYMYVCRRM